MVITYSRRALDEWAFTFFVFTIHSAATTDAALELLNLFLRYRGRKVITSRNGVL